MSTQMPPQPSAEDRLKVNLLAQSDIIGQIGREHRVLVDRLGELAGMVREAAEDGEADAEAVALLSWYRSAMLPHFKAAQATVYARGREREATALVVKGLLETDARIRELIEDLDAVDGPIEAVAAVSKACALFDSHVRHVQTLLLPALSDAGVDLADAVDGRRELIGGERGPAAVPTDAMKSATGGEEQALDPISGTEELDVRSLSHQQRHGIILGKMQALTDTGTLVLINDHDPKPLRYQAEAFWPNIFEWNYLEEGPEAWRVAISRIAAGQ